MEQSVLAESLLQTLRYPELAIVPLLPLVAFAFLILLGHRLDQLTLCGHRLSILSGVLAASALALSCVITFNPPLVNAVFHGYRIEIASWAVVPTTSSQWTIGLAVDGLSWVMLAVVTVVGTCIAVYSIGYMHGDKRFSRFFAYLALFCASMLGLVMANHFILLYVCWELVGLCSYLLISFWFEKSAAAAAGRKAFITTRIGDTGLFLGILLLWWTAHDLRFSQLDAIRTQLDHGLLTLISTLIFLGAVGKSAQVPLHVWLPDAMEGPTPVSALIHAATMVAAGVYLVARTLPLFTPESLQVVLALGLVTHLFAGTVALTMTDIKRVLAYSTLSQLGLMMTALGLGAAGLAMFHLVTHACFKALLFLAAGSVIHATHQQDLAHLGGLRRAMPWTAAVFLIAALSMSGLFFLSGFWSKDAILLEAQRDKPWVLWLLLLGAAMTAGYIFRLYLRCFEGQTPDEAGHHPHESPTVMVASMALLAVGAALIGLVGSPWLHGPFFRVLGAVEAHEGVDLPLLVASWSVAGVGIWLAWTVGVKRRNLLPAALRPFGSRLWRLAANKYYVDEIYARLLITPFLAVTRGLSRFDLRVIDGAVNGAGSLGWWIGQWKERFDRMVVDRSVNGIAETIRALGALLRQLQTGIIQQYLLVVVVSVVVLSFVLRR